MSYRVSGTTRRLRPAARAALLLGLIGLVAGPLAPLADRRRRPDRHHAVPGGRRGAGLHGDVQAHGRRPDRERVDLKTAGVPDGWTARFRGGGLTVDGAFVEPQDPPTITLDVEIPDGAPASSNTITVTATGGGQTDVLPLSIRVADAAAGDVTLTADFAPSRAPRPRPSRST